MKKTQVWFAALAVAAVCGVMAACEQLPVTVTKYEVSFDMNGDKGDPPAMRKVKKGERLTLPRAQSASGLTFIEWRAESEKGETAGKAGQKYQPPSDITLYAIWEGNSPDDPEQAPGAGLITRRGRLPRSACLPNPRSLFPVPRSLVPASRTGDTPFPRLNTPLPKLRNSSSFLRNFDSFLRKSGSFLHKSDSFLHNSISFLRNSESFLFNSESFLRNSESFLFNSDSFLHKSDSFLRNSNSFLRNFAPSGRQTALA